MRRKPMVLAGAALAVAALTCGSLAWAETPAAPRPSAGTHPDHATHGGTIRAERVAKVAALDPPSRNGHITLLEGAAWGPDGRFYFVDLTAPAGRPKVLRFDPRTKRTVTIYTDRTSVFSSLQFGPRDGKIYLTGYTAGTIVRMNRDGSGRQTVFSGKVAGRTMLTDDIAFDRSGAMYVTDYSGTPADPSGRLVRLDADGGNPVVLHNRLSAPNGVSFTPDYSSVWVSELNAAQERLLSVDTSSGSPTVDRIGMRANIGDAAFDSNAVDADGNVYQCVPLAGKVLVWNHTGDLLATIVVPQDLPKPQLVSTNLAIRPGTRQGYLTVGGENGGYLYKFRAPGRGIRQSNGG